MPVLVGACVSERLSELVQHSVLYGVCSMYDAIAETENAAEVLSLGKVARSAVKWNTQMVVHYENVIINVEVELE